MPNNDVLTQNKVDPGPLNENYRVVSPGSGTRYHFPVAAGYQSAAACNSTAQLAGASTATWGADYARRNWCSRCVKHFEAAQPAAVTAALRVREVVDALETERTFRETCPDLTESFTDLAELDTDLEEEFEVLVACGYSPMVETARLALGRLQNLLTQGDGPAQLPAEVYAPLARRAVADRVDIEVPRQLQNDISGVVKVVTERLTAGASLQDALDDATEFAATRVADPDYVDAWENTRAVFASSPEGCANPNEWAQREYKLRLYLHTLDVLARIESAVSEFDASAEDTVVVYGQFPAQRDELERFTEVLFAWTAFTGLVRCSRLTAWALIESHTILADRPGPLDDEAKYFGARIQEYPAPDPEELWNEALLLFQ